MICNITFLIKCPTLGRNKGYLLRPRAGHLISYTGDIYVKRLAMLSFYSYNLLDFFHLKFDLCGFREFNFFKKESFHQMLLNHGLKASISNQIGLMCVLQDVLQNASVKLCLERAIKRQL